MVSLEHAVHETILCFRFVALAAHKGAGAVVATSAGTLKVFATYTIDKTSPYFTHAVGCDASHVSNWKSVCFIFDKVLDFIKVFL